MRNLIISLLFISSIFAFEPYDVEIDVSSLDDTQYLPSESRDFYYTKISDNVASGRVLSESAAYELKRIFKDKINFDANVFDRNGYRDYEDITRELRFYADTYKNLTRLFSIGKSVQGRELWVLEISLTPGRQDNFRPNFKYIANMHGDEVVGREMLMRLIELILRESQTNSRIIRLLQSVNLFIMPTMNPDGFERGTRENAQRYDLNRQFPDQFRDPVNKPDGRPIEVQNVMKWISSQQFTLSANLHGGDVVANYPWDGSPTPFPPRDNPTSDDDVFRSIAYEYARHNPTMMSNPSFKNGITNGAAWYSLFGGMQDWNYIWRGCMEITLELSYRKWPPASDLDKHWNENKESLLSYIELVNKGIRGFVLDEATNKPISNASIIVSGRQLEVKTRENGAYFRILLKGEYRLKVTAEGYEPVELPVVLDQDSKEINIRMRRMKN